MLSRRHFAGHDRWAKQFGRMAVLPTPASPIQHRIVLLAPREPPGIRRRISVSGDHGSRAARRGGGGEITGRTASKAAGSAPGLRSTATATDLPLSAIHSGAGWGGGTGQKWCASGRSSIGGEGCRWGRRWGFVSSRHGR